MKRMERHLFWGGGSFEQKKKTKTKTVTQTSRVFLKFSRVIYRFQGAGRGLPLASNIEVITLTSMNIVLSTVCLK